MAPAVIFNFMRGSCVSAHAGGLSGGLIWGERSRRGDCLGAVGDEPPVVLELTPTPRTGLGRHRAREPLQAAAPNSANAGDQLGHDSR